MDDPNLSDETLRAVHRDLTRVHRWLGNTAAILAALRRDPLPVRRVVDIGCGDGGLLVEIRRRLGVEVVGVDLRAPLPNRTTVPIVEADAVRAPLPEADVAIAVCLIHHLSERFYRADPQCGPLLQALSDPGSGAAPVTACAFRAGGRTLDPLGQCKRSDGLQSYPPLVQSCRTGRPGNTSARGRTWRLQAQSGAALYAPDHRHYVRPLEHHVPGLNPLFGAALQVQFSVACRDVIGF